MNKREEAVAKTRFIWRALFGRQYEQVAWDAMEARIKHRGRCGIVYYTDEHYVAGQKNKTSFKFTKSPQTFAVWLHDYIDEQVANASKKKEPTKTR